MTEDERLAQEYLTRLQESVGRGEISLTEYDRLADLALSNIPASSQVAHAELARRAAGTPMVSGDPTGDATDTDGKKSALDLAIKSLFVLWFIAVAINLAVWLGVCLTVGKIYYFWPMWVILPGIIFPAIRWLREYL